MDLFETMTNSTQQLSSAPLAERLRPTHVNAFVGQEKAFGPNSHILKQAKNNNFLPNLIFWGPPGTGKTTMAKLLSGFVKAHYIAVSAIGTGAKDLRELGEGAKLRRLQFNEKTLLFIDEIHRLNRSQQDVLLPYLERGDLSLIGATTENPAYELNGALLSRSQVIVFERHTEANLRLLLERALQADAISIVEILNAEAISQLISWSDGDARKLLNATEILIQNFKFPPANLEFPLTGESFVKLMHERTHIAFDKDRDAHYDTISAFIKSVRGSDPDAAVYYLARMLAGGENPLFIARRLVILASEDISNADPKALEIAVAGLQAVELIGLPECAINLSQVVTYLACAPKSNRSYLALKKAESLVAETGSLEIPKHLRSAQTKMARDLGYGKDYKYSHDYPRGYSGQSHLPEKIKDEKIYEPSDLGFEKKLKEYLSWLRGT